MTDETNAASCDYPSRGAAGDDRGSLIALPRGRAPKNRPPDNLPLELSSFVGREWEIARIEELLTGNKLLTLTGPGGSGKTRLAVQAARGLVERFESGAWLVELASLADPDLVPQAVASVLGVREVPGRSLEELLVEHLGAREVLLLLDNCEHLLVRCAALVAALLRACPNLKVLVTSRETLGMACEVALPVPSLSLPGAGEEGSPESLLRYDAIKLYHERAGSAVPDFKLTPRNAPEVIRLCERLDGMPLAIELAATRVRMLSPRQILERLDDRFRLLSTGDRMAEPRQRSLRAAIDWSYELLSEEEKALLRGLSVFAGDFSLEAAEAVCLGEGIARGEVLDLVGRLVGKSLVVAEERGEGGEVRYRLQETIQQYAAEKLKDAGEEEAVRDRHAGFFLELAEEAELAGPEQDVWLGRLDAERHDLWEAVGWLGKVGDAQRALKFVAALGRFLWLEKRFDQGHAMISGVLDMPGAKARTKARADALSQLAEMVGRRFDYPAETQRLHEESLSIRREIGDERGTAEALRHLGLIRVETEEWDEARTLLEESLKIERTLGEDHDGGHGFATAQWFLAWLEHFRGKNATARLRLEEAIGIFDRLGDAFYAGTCLFFLGRVATDEGELNLASECFARGLELTQTDRYYWVIPYHLEAVARLAAARGHAERALELVGAAEAQREAAGLQLPPAWVSYLERSFAQARAALGEEKAAAAFEEGRAMTVELALAKLERELNEEDVAGPTSKPRPELLRIFALGHARVYRGDRALASSDWTYTKSRELLFYLLSHPSRTKEQIGLDLWPDASVTQLRRSFHNALYHLRRALGKPEWVVFENGRYSFDRSLSYRFDVEVFEKELERAGRLARAGSPAQAIPHLEEAVELYRGDFLEDLTDCEWCIARQEELRRVYLEGLLALGRSYLDGGRHKSAADAYRKAIAHDGLLEAAHRGLMHCHVASGERGRAIRQYETLDELLREQIGSSPAPETRMLHERLRRNEDV